MPEPIPAAWIDAALAADVEWMRKARAVVFVSPSRDQVEAMLGAAAPLIAAAERERIRQFALAEAAKMREPGEGWLNVAASGYEDFADLLSTEERDDA